jgi:hypothetical protein
MSAKMTGFCWGSAGLAGLRGFGQGYAGGREAVPGTLPCPTGRRLQPADPPPCGGWYPGPGASIVR